MKPKWKIGTKVKVEGTYVEGKITHIRPGKIYDGINRYKVEGRYWNEGSLKTLRKKKR